MILTNWGLYPQKDVTLLQPANETELKKHIVENDFLIPRGNGRCYGDASLANKTVSITQLKEVIHFDDKQGTIECQTGILLSEILELIVPHGFFLPVSPGTKFITLGGAIAADIHGKNHHKEGAISSHVLAFELMNAGGTKVLCSQETNSDLFWSTFGAMGTTGIIVSAKIKLLPIETAYIRQVAIKARNIEHLFELFENNRHYTYSVAWIDSLAKGKKLGRSVLLLGEHAKLHELDQSLKKDPLKVHRNPRLTVPFMFPNFFLNKWVIRLFNFLFYNKQIKSVSQNCLHYDAYFYPLDIANSWNKIYGRNGFLQYQFVIPFSAGKPTLIKLFKLISESGFGSFLTVLKEFGDGNVRAKNSFPIKGYTFAMDIKITDGIFPFLEKLDKIVSDHGGKIYIAKDARLSGSEFKKQYPKFDKPGKFSSFLTERYFNAK
jgi:decaprenylphospho-beta-D-ribofuranose 2-oxidase